MKALKGISSRFLFISLCALPFWGQAASAAENCTGAPQSGQAYSLINAGSDFALDVDASDPTQPNVAASKMYVGATNQKFVLQLQSNNYWTITSSHNNQALSVLNMGTYNGATVITDAFVGNNSQYWELKPTSVGTYKIVAKHSSKSLTVSSAANGSNVYQNDDANQSSQRWYLNPVNGNCGSGSGSGSGGSSGSDGFAGQPGSDGLSTTTGGGNTAPVVVSNCSALVSALESNGSAVVQIPANVTINCHTANRVVAACPLDCGQWNDPGKTWYRVPTSSAQKCTDLGSTSDRKVNVNQNERRIMVKSNKTLEGLGSGSRITGATLYVQNVKNVIVRNLKIEDINPALVEAGDGLTVNDSSHVLISHVYFKDISDGFVDFANSKNVTMSWNHFDGRNPQLCANHHWYTNLVKDSQVTFHHNFWDAAAGRNPKVEGGYSRVHLYNNYWKNITYFGIGVTNNGQAIVENNVFENTRFPQWDEGAGYIQAKGNAYLGTTSQEHRDNTSSNLFTDTQLYRYNLDSTSVLANKISNGVGPQ